MKTILSLILASASTVLWAGTWYVDCNSTAEAPTGSESAPYKTIQAAVEAAKEGDEIVVLPGVYGDNQGIISCTSAARISRVYLKKKLTLRSRDGRDTTIIEGKADSTTGDTGSAAVTCLSVATNCTVRGFTFRNGFSKRGSDSAATSGGGSYDFMKTASSTYFYDCTFENCSAGRGAAARYGKFVRCFFKNNFTSNPGGVENGTAVREIGAAYFCVFSGNGGTGCLLEYSAGEAPIVHCTFTHNTSAVANSNSTRLNFKNCVIENGISNANPAGKSFESCLMSCSSVSSGATDEACQFGVFGANMVDPLRGDGRLHANEQPMAASFDIHDAIPEAYRGKDVDGNVYDTAKLVPGAWPNAVTTAGGKVLLRSCDTRLLVDAEKYEIKVNASNYFYDVTWPVKHEVKFEVSNVEKDVYRVTASFDGLDRYGDRAALTLDNRYAFTSPSANHTLTLKPDVGTICYVDCNSMSETEDGSADNPYKTLAKACEAKKSSALSIHVKPGVYSNGTSSLGNHNCRFALPSGGYLRVKAVEGAEKTIVVGAADPETLEDATKMGCGTNAVRIFATGANCQIQGFTFTGGYTAAGTSSNTIAENGSTVAGVTLNNDLPGGAVISDCIISNNVSWGGATCYGGHYVRCLVTNNRNVKVGTLFKKATVANSAIANNGPCGNATTVTVFGDDVKVYSCSADCGSYQAWNGSAKVYNSVVKAGKLGDSMAPNVSGNVLDEKAFFVAVANNDLRQLTVSGLGVATTGIVDNVEWSWYAGYDLTQTLVPFINGAIVAGAYGELVNSVLIGATAQPVATGETIEVTAAERPLEGIYLNGVKVSSTSPYMYTAPASETIADVITFNYLTDFYVNPTATAEGADGSQEKPYRTLATALANVVSGDTIHLAEGSYAEGEMIHARPIKSGTTLSLKARAVVPSGVTVVGDGDAEKVIVRGQSDTERNDSGYGLGPNAMRVFVLEEQAVIKNLTIADGRASDENTEDDNNHGAGVLARNEKARVENCILTNNIAYRGGGGRYGTYVRCRFVGNRCIKNGSAGRDGEYYGCYFNENRGGEVLNFFREVKGCTFGNNSADWLLGSCAGTRTISNCFFGGVKILGDGKADLYACVIPEGSGVFKTPADITIDASCVMASGEALELAADGRPIIGQTAGIDAGDLVLWQAMDGGGNTDAAGGQRVYNASMDIGCYEADWRGEYAKVLNKKAIVTQASAGVALQTNEDGTKTVKIPKGESLAAAFSPRVPMAPWMIAAAVSGGILAIDVNDERMAEVETATISPVKIKGLTANNQVFHFSQLTDGDGLLGAMKQEIGFVIVFR